MKEKDGDRLLEEVADGVKGLFTPDGTLPEWKGLADTQFGQRIVDLAGKAKEAERVILEQAVVQLHGLAMLAQHFLPPGTKVNVPTLEELKNVR
jgi:hypothetical protein